MRSFIIVCCFWVGVALEANWFCARKIVSKTNPPEKFSEWFQLSKQPNYAPISGEKTRFHEPFLIVGGGPAGLAAAVALGKAGVPFLLVERHTELGGLWNQTNPQSPAYDSLHANSSYLTTHLGDPFNPTKSGYPSAEEARKYLIDFAHQWGIGRGIHETLRLGTNVKGKISFNERSQSWCAVLDNGKFQTYEFFSGVIVATGKYSRETAYIPPNIKKQVSDSGIPAMHTAYYRNPEFYKGKNVLIYGLGNSGAEIATEVSQVANKVIVSTRSTPWLVPLYIRKIGGIFGKRIPADEFAMNGPKLPHWLEMFFFHVLQRKYVGHPTEFGFTKKPSGLLDKIPVSDRGFSKAILEGRILIQPEVESIEGKVATFDGTPLSSYPIDAVIFATGYKKKVPFISEEMANFEDPDFRLPFNIFHPTQKTLFFMSETQVPQGGWPMFERQANAIAGAPGMGNN